MRKYRGRIIGLLFAWTMSAGAIGCDDRSKIPPELEEKVRQQQTEPQAPPRPTTQELISGSYLRLKLDALPLSLSVPAGWKIDHLGAITMLEGPTPFDTARIQLSHRDHVNQSQLDLQFNGAKKDQASADPQAQMYVDRRDAGAVKLLERRSLGRKMSIPITDPSGVQKLDEHGQPIAQVITPMRWKLNVFVPTAAGEFDQYELNFIDLSIEQYQADKAFLEKILYSVESEEAPPGPAKPAVPAPAR